MGLMPIRHAFVSDAEQSEDETLVSKNEWNADHTGVLWTPDELPSSASAWDDEFTSLSGWTNLGTFDSLNVTDTASHLHMVKNSIGYATIGVHKTMPAFPFVMTAHLRASLLLSNYVQAALGVSEASPGKLWIFGPLYGGYGASVNDWVAGYWSSPTVRAGVLDTNGGYVPTSTFLRLVVGMDGSVIPQWSRGGLCWASVYAMQYMPFAMTDVGLYISGNTGGGAVEAYWDWIRFSGLGSVGGAIPVMTDNTHPSGTVFASTYWGDAYPWAAFNIGSTYHGWITNGSALPQWIGYTFPSAITAQGYSIRPWFYNAYPGRTPKTWEFQGSNDAWGTHTTLDSQTNWASANSTDTVYFPISSPGSYVSYRLYITANNGDTYTGVGNLQIYVTR